MPGLIDTYRGYVSLPECDEMGHMNIQFYLAKTSDASFHMRTALGLGGAGRQPPRTGYVALEHHIRFHRELRASDLVVIRSGVVEIGDKTMRVYQEMRNAADETLAATFVIDIGHLDLEARKLVPWPEESRTRAEGLRCARPPQAAPRSLADGSLDRDATLDRARALGMAETNRSAVNPWECDANGHMNARFYMARFSDCQGHMWAQAGLDRHAQAARNLATATVEMRLAYFRELDAGRTIVVRTGLECASEKTLRYRHWMFDAETGDPAAAAEGIALLFDKDTRKAVPLPVEIAPVS